MLSRASDKTWWRSTVLASQRDQACGRRAEPAALEVEPRQVLVVEVDVQPLAPGGAGLLGRESDEPSADPLAASRVRDQSVEDERVDAAVPRHIHEAGQLTVVACADPAQAVLDQLRFPVVSQQAVAEALGVQRVELRVPDRAAPFIADHCRHRNGSARRTPTPTTP